MLGQNAGYNGGGQGYEEAREDGRDIKTVNRGGERKE